MPDDPVPEFSVTVSGGAAAGSLRPDGPGPSRQACPSGIRVARVRFCFANRSDSAGQKREEPDR